MRGRDIEYAISDDLWIQSLLIKSEWLSSHLSSNKEDEYIVNLKLDALQLLGSFKIRGISQFMKL